MKEIMFDKYFWQNDLVRLRAANETDWEFHYYNRFDTPGRRQVDYLVELPPTISEEKRMMESFVDFKPGTGRLMFIIENFSNETVGMLNLNALDERNGTFGIGIQVDRDQRGKGYGTAAMRILLRYAFFERRLNKLNNAVIEGNIASLTMFKKLGAKVEGTRRQTVFMDGRYIDETLVGITRADFEEKEKEIKRS